MKAKKLLAVLLAVLMVIPAMVMPTAAADTATVNATPEAVTLTHQFTIYDESEEQYLCQIGNGNNKGNDNGGRQGEGHKYTVWQFALQTTTVPDKVVLSARCRYELVIDISLDGVTWKNVYSIMELTQEELDANTDSNRHGLVTKRREFDITDAVQKLKAANPDACVLYVRLDDVDKDATNENNDYVGLGGFGGLFIQTEPVKLELTYPAGTALHEDINQVFSFVPSKDYSTEAPYYYYPTLKAADTTDGTTYPYKKPGSDDTAHFADGNGRLIYAYELTTAAMPTALRLFFQTGNQLHLSVSTNAFDWVDVYKWDGTPAENGSGGLAANSRVSYDLLAAYQEAFEKDPSNMLYISIGDSHPDKGYGGKVYYNVPFFLNVSYPDKQAVTGEEIKVDFDVQGEDEEKYYVNGGYTTGTNGRYADRTAKIVYKYPITNVQNSSKVTLTATVLSQFSMELSLDNEHWVRAFIYRDKGVLYKLNKAATTGQSVYFFAEKERTFDLTAAIAEAKKVTTSTDALYIRIGDSHPVRVQADGTEMTADQSGYNSGAGWGGNIKGTVTLTVRTAEGMEYGDVNSVCITPPVSLDSGTGSSTSSGDKYKFTSTTVTTDVIPMLVTDENFGVAETVNGTQKVLTPGQFSDTTLAETSVDETKAPNYVYMGPSSIEGRYWCGHYKDNGYFAYRYKLPKGVTRWEFDITLGGDYAIFAAYGDEKAPHPVNERSRYTLLKDCYTDNGAWGGGLNYRLHFGDTVSENEAAEGEYLYLLFADYSWWRTFVLKEGEDGYSAPTYDETKKTYKETLHNGSGPRVIIGTRHPITLTSYVLPEVELYKNEITMGTETYQLTDDFVISKIKAVEGSFTSKTHNGVAYKFQNYTFAETEPVLVTDAGINQGKLSANMAEDDDPTVEPNPMYKIDEENLIALGDGNYYGRSADNSYFVYKYKLPDGVTHFDWNAKVGGQYGIYVAFGDTCPAGDSSEWKLVKDHVKDGYTSNASYNKDTNPNSFWISRDTTVSYDVMPEDVAKGSYVFMKFTDFDYVDDNNKGVSGWGARVNLGTNYPVKMTWSFPSAPRDINPSVSDAALALKENFNLIFKLATPGTANDDTVVSITWADGTPANVIDNKDGTYTCADILPQQMTQDLIITYTGTCMDKTPYTAKEYTYSVKDYCMRMLSRDEAYYADAYGFTAEKTAAVKQLLSDALVYGAAAQKYVFDDGELATDGVVGLKPSEFVFENLDQNKYKTTLSGDATAQGAYKWTGVTLVLDNTVAIRYTLYTEDTAPTVMVNGTAYTPVAADEANYYYVDVPVYAGKFATEYVASFDGVEGYTVTYSVNHYVARNYDASQKLTSALIAALYNYGASAAAYAAK